MLNYLFDSYKVTLYLLQKLKSMFKVGTLHLELQTLTWILKDKVGFHLSVISSNVCPICQLIPIQCLECTLVFTGSAADSAFTDEAGEWSAFNSIQPHSPLLHCDFLYFPAQSTSMSSTSSPLQSPVSPPSRASAPPSNSFSSQSLPSRSASVQDIRHSPKKPVPSSNLRSAGSLPSVQMTPNHFTIPIQLPGSMTNGTGEQGALLMNDYPTRALVLNSWCLLPENATMASPQMMLPPGYALIPMAMPTNQQNSHSKAIFLSSNGPLEMLLVFNQPYSLPVPPGYALVPMMPQMFNAMQQFNPFMQQNGEQPILLLRRLSIRHGAKFIKNTLALI